jgi:hypothetical protein
MFALIFLVFLLLRQRNITTLYYRHTPNNQKLGDMVQARTLMINTEIKKGCAGLTPSTAFLKSVLPLKPLFIEGFDL